MTKKLEWFAQRRATTEPLWKVMAYTTTGVNFPVESNESFPSLEEAQWQRQLNNAGIWAAKEIVKEITQ